MRARRVAGARAVGLLVAAAAFLGACTAAPSPQAGVGPQRHGPSGAAPSPEAAPAALPLRAGERARVLDLPGGPYRPGADGGLDDYRCFLLDPRLDGDAFLTGADVMPGNPDVVHHAILFSVPPDRVGAALDHDAATPGRGWTCFGGAALPGGADTAAGGGLDTAPWLAAWAPGGGETVFGAGTGKALPAGSRIVLQLHYNLREGSEPDATAVRLRIAPGTASLRPLETMLLVAPVELPCTSSESGRLCDRSQAVLDLVGRFGEQAGRTVSGLQLLCGGSLVAPRAGPVQSCSRRAPDDMVVHAVAGHMHLLGRSITVELAPGSARARTLLDRPVWDFDDQRATSLPRPVRVRRGESLQVTCTHDAGLRALVPELADEAPRHVVWGDGTSDEMCLGIVLYTRGRDT